MTLAIQDASQTISTATQTAGTQEQAVQDWRTGLPEELRTEKSLASYKDVGALAKSHVEAQRMLGGSIRLPKPDATPEDRQKILDDIYGKLGRPAKAEDYGIGEPDLPEGVPWSMEGQREFLGQAHALGLTKDQAVGVLEWYADRVTQASLMKHQDESKVLEELKGEWGGASDRNLAMAKRAVETVGGPKLKAFLNDSGLGNHPELIRVFARVGKMMAEAQMISGRVEGILSPEEAKKKIAEIQANPEDLYHMKHAGKSGHDERVAEVKGLFELAYPTVL